MSKRIAKKRVVVPKVKKIALPPAHVLHVSVPKDHVPIVATDPDQGVVKIIPVPAAKLKDKTWFERWFG